MGHASPAITLSTYSHLFDGHAHAEKLAAMLEADWGEILKDLGNAATPTLRLAMPAALPQHPEPST